MNYTIKTKQVKVHTYETECYSRACLENGKKSEWFKNHIDALRWVWNQE